MNQKLIFCISFLVIFCLIGTVRADITYHEGWYEFIHSDGTNEIVEGYSWYKRFDGEIRPRTELNIASGDWPYLLEENSTHYMISRMDDTLIINKNIGNLYFGFDKIALDFKVTPVQLAGRSVGPYNINGVNWWGIHIPESVVITTKQFNWDSRLPTVQNNTLVNYTGGSEDNYTVYGSIDQSNFRYRRINNKLYFVYNQHARDWGASSELITFTFNSWDIVGSGGSSWSGNVTYDSNITLVQCIGNIELQDAVPNFISKWRFDNSSLLDENETNNNDGTNHGVTYNSSGKWDGAYEFNLTESDHITISDSPELDGVSNMAWSFWVYPTTQGPTKAFISKYTASSGARSWGVRNGAVMGEIDLIVSSDGETFVIRESSGFNLQNNAWTHIAVRFVAGEVYFYKNKQYISTGTTTGHTSIFGGTADVYIGRYATRYYDGLIDDVRIYGELSNAEINKTRDNHHKITGNVTRNYSSIIGAGDELKTLKYCGTGNVTLYASIDNITYDLIQVYAVSGTGYDVSGKGYEYGKWKLNTTDASQTPIIYNISVEYGEAGVTPNITSWENNKTNNNSLDITINTSEEVNFNATANQTIITWNWYKDDVDQSWNYDNTTLSWSSTGSKTVKVNATNSNGTSDTITWNVTVVDPDLGPTPAPSISVSPVQYDELDLPLILYIVMISMLYLFIAFRHGVAAVELSLIYLIFAFFFLLFQTITISVNYIYLTLFLLLFLISIAGITKQGVD